MKLKLIYEPEGGQRQQWVVDFSRFMSFETEWLEEAGGTVWADYPEFLERLESDNRRAWRALLWVMLKQQNPDLQFQHVVYRDNEISFAAVEDEPPVGKGEHGDSDTGSPSPPLDSAA